MLIISLQLLFFAIGFLQSRRTENARLSIGLTLLCFAVYVFVTGLRWRTGTDWLSYEGAFNLAQDSSVDDLGTTFEPGYLYFIKAVAAISEQFSALLLLQSLAIAYFVFRAAQYLKLPPVMLLASLLMVQSQFWYPVRQQISISIIALAFSAFIVSKQPKTLVRLLQIFAASMIHLSALITIPVLIFLRQRRRLLLSVLAIVAVIFTVYLLRDTIFNLIFSRVGTYIVENAYESESGRLYLRLAERVGSFIIAIYLVRSVLKKRHTQRFTKALYVLITSGFVISLFSLSYFPYLARIALYFNWAEAVVLAGSIRDSRYAKLPDRFVIAMWVLLLGMKFIGSLYSYWDLLDPYYFVFEDVDRDVY